MLRRFTLPIAALWFGLSYGLATAAEEAALAAATASITAEELAGHINVLADDTMEGREAGSRGGRAASGYIAGLMAKRGLAPGGIDRTYYQPFYNNQRNILGVLHGSDPVLKKQVLIVGAHYDHVGYGSASTSYGPIGTIHNGADDNASGVSALLAVAKAYQRLGEAPRRTILFACWDGEEKGLLGSRYWLEHSTVPVADVPLAINIDMVGRLRNGRLEVAGTRTAAGLRRLVSQQIPPELTAEFTWELKENSDHWPFFARNVPILMLHTKLHSEYHRPSDDAHLINKEGLRQVSQLLFRLTLDLANADRLPGFRQASRGETPDTQRELERPLPPPPVRLGVTWDDQPADGGQVSDHGLRVSQVSFGSPAAKVQLRPGDRLRQVNGEVIRSGDHFRSLMAGAPTATRLTIERPGEDKPLDIAIELAGQPVRVGIAWRDDPAEPGTVLLTRVVLGSPAAGAGLQPGDRIYRIDGETFAAREALERRLLALAGAVELEVERGGRLRTVALEVPALLAAEVKSAEAKAPVVPAAP